MLVRDLQIEPESPVLKDMRREVSTYYENGTQSGVTGPTKFRDYDPLESTTPVPARI